MNIEELLEQAADQAKEEGRQLNIVMMEMNTVGNSFRRLQEAYDGVEAATLLGRINSFYESGASSEVLLQQALDSLKGLEGQIEVSDELQSKRMNLEQGIRNMLIAGYAVQAGAKYHRAKIYELVAESDPSEHEANQSSIESMQQAAASYQKAFSTFNDSDPDTPSSELYDSRVILMPQILTYWSQAHIYLAHEAAKRGNQLYRGAFAQDPGLHDEGTVVRMHDLLFLAFETEGQPDEDKALEALQAYDASIEHLHAVGRIYFAAKSAGVELDGEIFLQNPTRNLRIILSAAAVISKKIGNENLSEKYIQGRMDLSEKYVQ